MDLDEKTGEIPKPINLNLGCSQEPMKVSLIYPSRKFLDSFELMEAKMNNSPVSDENRIQ